MATREYYFTWATGESTTTATGFLSAATLSFTPSDNQSYAMFWGIAAQHDDLTTDVLIELRDNSSSATLSAANVEVSDTNNYLSYGGLAFSTFATATGSRTYNVRYGNETATTTSRARNASLTALRLDAADHFRESVSAVTTTATSAFQTVATFSFTPSATGNYIIIASADWRPAATTGALANIRLNGGGTATDYMTATMTLQSNNSFRSWVGAVNLPLTASQWDWSIDVLGATNSLTTTRNMRFLALRADGFESVDSDQEFSNNISTTTSSATIMTFSATTQAREYLVLGTAQHRSGSLVRTIHSELVEDGTIISTLEEEPAINSNARFPAIVSYTKSFTAAAHTLRWSHYGSAGDSFYHSDEGFLMLLDLEGTAAAADTIIPQIADYYRRRRVA